jgi:preprotein translocase subunit SecA
MGVEDWSQVERVVLLRTIDSLWVEHLTEVDDLRRGVGLRGYAQQDPLNEFRRDAFRMYEELRGLIRHGVASSIFRVTIQREPAPDVALARSLSQGAAALRAGTAVGGGNGAGAVASAQPAAAAAVAAGAAETAGARAAGSAILRGSLPTGPAARNVRESLGDQPLGDGSGNGAGVTGGARPGYTPTGARIGRNDPCWCGSGAKYKKCHGR